MNTSQQTDEKKAYGCETCALRAKAEENPESLMARIWRWHTRWCSGWKEYQAYLSEQTCQIGEG